MAGARLRDDFDGGMVRAVAKTAKDGPQVRRLLALAAIYEGATRSEAARIGGVTLQIVRDPVLRFNTSGPVGLINRKARGPVPILDDTHRLALALRVEPGPTPDLHGVVRWRVAGLCQWILTEFQLVVTRQTLSRDLRRMGYRKLSARPRHHAQAAGAIEDFKEPSRHGLRPSRKKKASPPTG